MPTLKELRSQHRNIIQMSFNGYANKEIAERLGMAQSSVSIILRSPLGQAYMNGLQDRAQEATLDVRKKLVSLNKDALDTIARLLNPKEKAPHSVQFSAAKDVLDRTGYKAPDRLNVDMTFQTKTDEELDAEISAIEASVNRTKSSDLPKVESHQVCESQINSTPAINDVSSLTAFSSLASSSIVSSLDNDDDLPLEDSLPAESYYFTNFENEDLVEAEVNFNSTNHEDTTNLSDDTAYFEDQDLLNNLSFDPFHNIKRN